jgi:hypothetical protein
VILLSSTINNGIAAEYSDDGLGILFTAQFNLEPKSWSNATYFMSLINEDVEDRHYSSLIQQNSTLNRTNFIDHFCEPRDSEECKESRLKIFLLGLGIAWVAYEMGMFDLREE